MYTSVWVAFLEGGQETKRQNITNRTDVYFNQHIDNNVLTAYIDSKEPFGKAGAYGIQGLASTFVQKIDGDFYSVWGFPLTDFCNAIRVMID